MVAPQNSGYSAKVRLELVIGDHRLPLAQIGNDRLMFDHPTILPGTVGEVIARVDDNELRWHATWTPSESPRQTIMAEFRDAG